MFRKFSGHPYFTLFSMKIEAYYFTGSNCNVCKVLKPKLKELFKANFPKASFFEINIEEDPAKAADFMVFTIPVLVLLVDGKEYIKFVRTFSLKEVEEKLERVYKLLEY